MSNAVLITIIICLTLIVLYAISGILATIESCSFYKYVGSNDELMNKTKRIMEDDDNGN